MPTPTNSLLSELDALAYPRRMATLAQRARELAAAGTLPAILADLREGDRHARLTAVALARVVGDRDTLPTYLDDPFGPVRADALKACLRAGLLSGADLADYIVEAPAAERRHVTRLLRRMGRPGVADAVVDPVRERWGDVEAAALLPACGTATVRRLLPELDHAVRGWAVLVRRHRGAVLDHVAATLAATRAPDRVRRWQLYGEGVLAASAAEPVRVLELLERYAPPTTLPGSLHRYGALAAAAPARVVALLAAPARATWLRRTPLPQAVLRRLGAPDIPLVELGRRLRDDDRAFAALLRRVAPAQRGALYDAVLDDVDTAAVVPSEVLMAVLPRAVREREARRILALPHVRNDEEAVLTWTAYLPWEEAVTPLTAATRRAGADDRAAGYRLLLQAAGRSADPLAFPAALARLDRLRNEQDPVRAEAVSALASMPRQVRGDSVEMLTRIAIDATEARDASVRTLSTLGTLAAAVLQHHHDDPELRQWSLDTMDKVTGGHRLPPLGRFDRTLRRGQEHLVFARLRPWIEAGMARGYHAALFAVTRALGRRARGVAELQELLQRAVDPTVVTSVLRDAITAWLDDPASRSDRVAQVLEVDSSAVTIGIVWHTICTRRTDLLDRVLIGTPPTGRFLSVGTRWVPSDAIHVDRWSPRHQQAYVRLLRAAAADAGAAQWSRAAAIAAAARVPGAGRAVVDRYVGSSDVVLAEAALAALPWTDRPVDALDVLLGHADDDRARVAVYAAGRAARFVRPGQLRDRLAPCALGRGKVTSRKEALRLLGAYGPPSAFEVLRQAWQEPGQHRDVRAAIVSAAGRRLQAPSAWQILEEAVHGGREDVLAVLAVEPEGVAEHDRPRYAGLVASAIRSDDRVVAQAAWAQLRRWLPWAPDVTEAAVAVLQGLDDDRSWRVVADTVGALVRRAAGTDGLLVAAFRALVALDATDTDPGGPARDRPARRRIDQLATVAAEWGGDARWGGDDGPLPDAAPVRAAARELAGAYVPMAGRLLVAVTPLDAPDPADLVAAVTEIAELADGRPVLAAELGKQLSLRRWRSTGTWNPAAVRVAVQRLTERGDAVSGLLAVGLVRAGEERGWASPWREALHRLRDHSDPEVREAAYDECMLTE